MRTKIKRKIRSFEAETDVDSMIAKAQAAGLTVNEIVNVALQKYGAETIKLISEEKIARLKSYPKRQPDNFHLNDRKPDTVPSKGHEAAEEQLDKTLSKYEKKTAETHPKRRSGHQS